MTNDELISQWLLVKMERGRPTCPCGFVGGGQNIRKHRLSCPVWIHYCNRPTGSVARKENPSDE